MGFTTTYTYDGDNNVATVTDANGAKTSYTYDAMDRVSTMTDPMAEPAATPMMPLAIRARSPTRKVV